MTTELKIRFHPKVEIDEDGITLGTIIIERDMDFWEFHEEVIKLLKKLADSWMLRYYAEVEYDKVGDMFDTYQYIITIEFGTKLTKGYVVVSEKNAFYLGVEAGDEYELRIIFP